MTWKARVVALAAAGAVSVVVWLLRREPPPPARVRAAHVERASDTAPAPPPAPPAPPSVSGAAAKPSSPRPENENDFMHELMQLESTDKEAALALARHGESWYPGTGKPAEARKAMIVTLLADLNRMDEARSLGRAFMAAFPGSEYLPLVQGATGIHPRPHGPNGVVY